METGEQFESSNINIKWLENIYEQLQVIQNMERLAREGCNNIMEYMQIPFELRNVVLPDVEYKNLRFIVLEMDILITNLTPVLKEKAEGYKNSLAPLLTNLDDRNLFLKEIRKDKKVIMIETLPLMTSSIMYISEIKSKLIQDIGHLLYIPEENETKKKW
jgi:hypothetical protein